jgi:xanthine/uracil permease
MTSPDSPSGQSLEYTIDDRPPLPESVLLGVQHYLTMVGANIAVPLVLAGALGMPAPETAKLVGTFFVVSGIATLAQTTLGNRYPIVQGAPFSMLAPALVIVGVVQSSTPETAAGWNTALLHVQGAIIVAALVEVLIGYVGLIGKLRQYLSPIVIAPTIALIGLTLFDTPQITSVTQNWPLLLLTLALITVFSQLLNTRSRVFKLFPILLGMGTAYLVALVLSLAGIYTSTTPGFVGLARVADAPLVLSIYPLQWGTPQFETAFVIGMLAGVLASIVESIGDYHAVARMTDSGAPSAQRMNHGIGMEGLMNVFAGVMGAGGSTSYSENVGAIGITRVASRYVVQVGAVVMLAMGFIGPVGQLVATVPAPIIGGLFLAMFGQIAAVGLSNLKYVDLDSSRNLYILGLAFFAGLAVPAYMSNVGSASTLQAGFASMAVLGPVLGTDLVAHTVYVIGGTGMAVGGLVAGVLDNVLPGTDEERGVTAWNENAEAEAEFQTWQETLRRPADD